MLLALALLSSTVLVANAPEGDDWLGPDKALHFSVSAGISVAAYGGAMLITDDVRLRVALSSGISLLAGTAKELADLAGLGTPSWKDFAWDVIGTFTGVVTALLLDQLLISPLARLPFW
ncbi:MAG: hypothetical protein JNM17_36295 [Archangium sp.]|nr:hypothetical protein [Archangium sp.]